MGPQSRVIFEKIAIFHHLHPLKNVKGFGLKAKKNTISDFESTKRIFWFNPEPCFGLLPEGLKSTDRKSRDFF